MTVGQGIVELMALIATRLPETGGKQMFSKVAHDDEKPLSVGLL